MIEKFHKLKNVGDQKVCLHFFQIFFCIQTVHTGEPFGLFQNEDFGFFDARTGEHSCERKVSLFFFQLLQCAGIVAADRCILGILLGSRHHGGSHIALKGIAVLQDLVALFIGITQTGQHISCRVHIAGLCIPAVCFQIVVIHGILEDEAGRRDVDGVCVRIIGIGGCKCAAERQSPDRRVGVGKILCHIFQSFYLQQRGNDTSQRFNACGVPGIPVQPHLIIVL